MGNFKFYLFILFVSFSVSCSKDDPKEIKPIELSKRIAKVDHVNTSDHINILEGNGGYSITLKNIFIEEEFNDIPFENHMKISIVEDKITVERLLLEDYQMSVTCLLTDSEGVKKTFIIENPGLAGIHDFND